MFWAGSLQKRMLQIHPHTGVHTHSQTTRTHERARTYTCPCAHVHSHSQTAPMSLRAHLHTHVCNTLTDMRAHECAHTCPCTHPFTDCTHACTHASPGGSLSREPTNPLQQTVLAAPDAAGFPGRRVGGPEPWAASSHRSMAAPRRGPARSCPLALLKIMYGSGEHPCLRLAAESILHHLLSRYRPSQKCRSESHKRMIYEAARALEGAGGN